MLTVSDVTDTHSRNTAPEYSNRQNTPVMNSPAAAHAARGAQWTFQAVCCPNSAEAHAATGLTRRTPPPTCAHCRDTEARGDASTIAEAYLWQWDERGGVHFGSLCSDWGPAGGLGGGAGGAQSLSHRLQRQEDPHPSPLLLPSI